MKKILSVLIATLVCFQIGFSAFAASPAKNTENLFEIQIVNNNIQFVKNNKITKTVPMKNGNLKLVPSKNGGIAVRFVDSNGKNRTFGLNGQTDLKIKGKLDSLHLDKKLSAKTNVSLEKGSSVKEMKVAAPCKVSIAGKVNSVQVTNAKAAVSAQKTASVGKVTAVAGSKVQGVSSSKVTVSSNSTLSSSNAAMQEEENRREPEQDRDEDNNNREERPDSDNSNSSQDTTPSYRIDRIEPSLGMVKVTLNRATSPALTLDNFAILCNGSGKDMTILNVTTSDNRVYYLSTAYYADNEYFLSIELPDGKLINKTFTTALDAPEIKTPEVQRIDAATASIEYVSDRDGNLYYLLKEVANPSFRSVWEGEEDPTVSQIKASGTRVSMKRETNMITVEGLTENTAYTVFFVAEDEFGRTTPVKYADISASPADKPQQSEVTITSIVPYTDMSDFNQVHHWFDITLSADPGEELTLENFNITCPAQSGITLGRLEQKSATEYTLYLKENVILKDNNTFTFTITFADGNQTSAKLHLDLSEPLIGTISVIRNSESTATVTFTSNEDGTGYWMARPNSEVPEDTSHKDPQYIIEHGTQFPIHNGTNVLELTGIDESNVTFCLVAEDARGNQSINFDYKKIPNEITGQPEPEPPTENNLIIENINVTDYHHFANGDVNLFTVQLNTEAFPSPSDITIRGNGIIMNGNKQLMDFSQHSDNLRQFTFSTYKKLNPGTYTLTVEANGETATKEFTVS